MRHWSHPPRRTSRIEIIPMIDVMMFLLVFFVLASLNVIPATGLRTALPSSSLTQDLSAKRNAVVTISREGSLLLDGQGVALDELPTKLRALQRPGEKLSIVIKGDQATELQRLVDVMDALKSAGFDSLSIATKKR